ncbi:bifunctional diaminohydroxyphosphoribosylaminopyrimidine deaminase/5-amino-6-(5-phosphoribosylamino)uracil reductase RibD [Flavicella marina]|uniref:bifunctional diaminohydroxyphosphoribosylaminopyrimidine deaminase/5-amino-6-(5-phosphoribosylamino)uracil reductase RibD n=1 Tax=Flavicella marina TaxID=1475951 RepID=UPI001264F010|nr:bifunctional diaminohydroxyphosphoribosylaminopyrimidine deaminase/5-amino-6-(5-phosphoribosylamino)uracil reductase RibD [Flavicella marina]
MKVEEQFMARCIELAQNGIGTARPNPSVGCVVVYENKIIGEGFTSPYGGSHAEVNAIASVRDKTLLSKSTLYVTLEPCAHFGKTPPCADLIVKHKIPNVVIGCIDTHSVVAGKGVERLIENGCHVKVGVLENECLEQHKRFFTVQNKKRPYVILKWAQTKNGFIAPDQKEVNRPVWISNVYAQQLVHKWRSEEHAILVGTNTAIADNPKLNVRSWGGVPPVRVVLDRTLRISKENSLYDLSQKTIFVVDVNTEFEASAEKQLFFESIDFSGNVVEQICEVLMRHHIQSIIIEGGTQTLNAFINSGIWDEARVFVGDVSFVNGVEAPVISKEVFKKDAVKNTDLFWYVNRTEI